MTAIPGSGRWRVSSLTVRLAVAFLIVAFAAITLLTVVTLLGARGGVAGLVERQQQATVERVAAMAALAHEQAGGWRDADLQSAIAIAVADGGSIRILDASGVPVVSGPMGETAGMMRRMHGRDVGVLGPPLIEPVIVDGAPVGVVEVRFPVEQMARPEDELGRVLTRNVLTAAGLAGLLALVAAGLVAARVTRPLARLTGTVEAVAAGDRNVRSGAGDAPGEIGALSRAVDRMADGLERQEQLRRVLVADVAHELRTPLAVVLGEVDALLDGVNDPTPQRLSSLREEVLRLSRLVSDLEALAAAESAGLHLELEPLDLAEVVEDVLALHAGRIEEAGLELVRHLEPSPVTGDRLRLGQVVTNLLGNAARFTPPGGRVDVTVSGDDEHVTLTVTDDGPGITADDLPHVFERFWQGEAARGRGGSGIGLAVVAELARVHGGRVEATNAPGRGARLQVQLPRR